jgi:Carboxypeptidase regulatory-like domain
MTKKLVCMAASLLCLLLAVNGFGQSINASVGGTVADPSKALIPGVTITATNTGTGIANTNVTNESGAYNFPALQPGTYKLSAELPGFQTQTFTDVQLGGAQQVTLNFTLQVAAAAGQNVEVTVAADTILATTSNSIGTVLPEYKIRDLPSLTGNVFNLVVSEM